MARCFGDGDPLYAAYHDTEWGVPPQDFGEHEKELFERLTLEVFQVGLSWILILRRREEFRKAFAGFNPAAIAEFSESDVDRLVDNAGIIRNRRKIEATINNAQRVLEMHSNGESLAELFAQHRPAQVITRREGYANLPAFTDEAVALATSLKARGFSFVGPTNVYAMMQALGIVDDHLASCPVALATAATPQGSTASGEVHHNTASPGVRPVDIWDEARAPARTTAHHGTH